MSRSTRHFAALACNPHTADMCAIRHVRNVRTRQLNGGERILQSEKHPAYTDFEARRHGWLKPFFRVLEGGPVLLHVESKQAALGHHRVIVAHELAQNLSAGVLTQHPKRFSSLMTNH